MWSTPENDSILYYAVGGGWGHVHRSLRIIEQHLFSVARVYLVTNHHRFGYVPPANVEVVYMPPSLAYDADAYARYFRELLQLTACRTLWIDVFPWGVQGELLRVLPFIEHLPKVLVSRYVQWERYMGHCACKPPALEGVYLLEECHPLQKATFDAWKVERQPLTLNFPLPEGDCSLPEQPYGVVLHTGNYHEWQCLAAYAGQRAPHLRWYYVAPRPCPALGSAWHYAGSRPLRLLLENASCLVSAAGFNTMKELVPFREKHHVLPFARKYDNQFWRWGRHRLNSPFHDNA